ncbi:MAG: quinol:cytochrome C oxidoreductase [Planctomycetes bacterium]|nr:quinol:cytochrome C oxidoreductase [Planctomycetota bacterium]
MSSQRTAVENLGARGRSWGRIALVLGIAGLALGLWLGSARGDGFRRFEHAWLVSCLFFLSLSLGALFFVIIQHLVRAGWSVVVRRVAEIVAANTLVTALLFAPLVVQLLRGDSSLWPWADANTVHGNPLLEGKAGFLEPRFFALRCVLYFGIWILLGRWLLRRSTEQDTAQDAKPTLALERRAAPAMVAYALSVNFGAFDILMTLEPTWASTIFGVCFFAGSVIGFFALSILLLRFLQARGFMRASVGVEHYHDLGKFLFAFVFFWGYVSFSQFMLIWYADMPEETFWFRERFHGTWANVSWVLLFGHFVLPFAALLSRHTKRALGVLAFLAVWMLCMHAVELFWLVMPTAEKDGALVSGMDAACFVAVGGIWFFALARLAGERSLVPVGDPRLPESLAFENS